jgi:hypothetical protein
VETLELEMLARKIESRSIFVDLEPVKLCQTNPKPNPHTNSS